MFVPVLTLIKPAHCGPNGHHGCPLVLWYFHKANVNVDLKAPATKRQKPAISAYKSGYYVTQVDVIFTGFAD